MFSKQALRRLILPLIIEQFLAVMVGMADIMMVSSAGEAAVSSVALVDLINVLIINIFAALATGGAVVCAQSIGAQNLERANRAANQLLYIVTAAALGFIAFPGPNYTPIRQKWQGIPCVLPLVPPGLDRLYWNTATKRKEDCPVFSKQALRRLILPLIIEQFLAVMVGMADIMMVSSAGEAAVSSVALVDLINVLIINIFAALATGGAVVCAQSIGAQNLERANRAANQLLYIVTAAALGIMVLVLFCKAGLLGLLFGQVEPEVMEGAVTYFVISALSYPFIAVYNGCAALLRAMGNSKASMCVSAYMNGQNIAGNAVFVFVFHQGVAGVALSSLLSRIAAAGLMLALLHGRRNPVRVSGLLRFRFEPAVMAQILRIGVPNSLENSFFQLGRVLLVSLISTFGTAQTAANAVANNIDNFGVIPGQALGLALITVVGQCVGAGDWDQVRAYTKRLVKLTYLCTWGLNAALLLGLPLILRLYSLTPETQWYAAVLIFIHNGCAMLFWPLAFTMPNALRAAGDVRVPMVISITSMLVVRVGGSYLLGLHFGLGAIGVWLAMVGDWVVRLICFVLRARKKLWLEHR